MDEKTFRRCSFFPARLDSQTCWEPHTVQGGQFAKIVQRVAVTFATFRLYRDGNSGGLKLLQQPLGVGEAMVNGSYLPPVI